MRILSKNDSATSGVVRITSNNTQFTQSIKVPLPPPPARVGNTAVRPVQIRPAPPRQIVTKATLQQQAQQTIGRPQIRTVPTQMTRIGPVKTGTTQVSTIRFLFFFLNFNNFF